MYFFFNDTATTEIYTLSLHDALPISSSEGWDDRRVMNEVWRGPALLSRHKSPVGAFLSQAPGGLPDRKSTRLNSSHANISYAVFCLKKKKPYIQCPDYYRSIQHPRHS